MGAMRILLCVSLILAVLTTIATCSPDDNGRYHPYRRPETPRNNSGDDNDEQLRTVREQLRTAREQLRTVREQLRTTEEQLRTTEEQFRNTQIGLRTYFTLIYHYAYTMYNHHPIL
jgi:septal ring factor EnvC (AmiA/AmiB activator)